MRHALNTRLSVALKTLNAAYAYVSGHQLQKLYDSEIGLKFFSEVYETRGMQKMLKPWIEETSQTV